MMLENQVFLDYGIKLSMYNWMNHVMKDNRGFTQEGKMAYFTLAGNTFYFNTDESKDGFVGLKVQGIHNMTTLYDGVIGTR